MAELQPLSTYISESLFGDNNVEDMTNNLHDKIIYDELKKYSYDNLSRVVMWPPVSPWNLGQVIVKDGKAKIMGPKFKHRMWGCRFIIDRLDHTPKFNISEIVDCPQIMIHDCNIKNLKGIFAPGCKVSMSNPGEELEIRITHNSNLVSLEGLENLQFETPVKLRYTIEYNENLKDLIQFPKVVYEMVFEKNDKLSKINNISLLPEKILYQFVWVENGENFIKVCQDAGCGRKTTDFLINDIGGSDWSSRYLDFDEWNRLRKKFKS
jgi:hypothetical protein